jgi:hypothetical protein
VKPPGSHMSTGSQVSEPSRWRQTTTAPSFAREKCTTGDADSKSASGILSNGTPRTMPAISVQSKPLRLSYQTRAATVVSDPISTFIVDTATGTFSLSPPAKRGERAGERGTNAMADQVH